MAEVMKFEDLKEAGTEVAVKAGKFICDEVWIGILTSL